MNYVSLFCSIVACLIGVFSFLSSTKSKLKDEGVIIQKINQAILGIDELKSDVKGLSSNHQSLALLVNSHEEQIKTLFSIVHSSSENTQALITIMESLKHN